MLYLILPYFDFNKSVLSKKNLDLFISNYAKRANLKIILCEGIYDQELPDYSNKIFKHLKFKLKNILWVKENLINLAIKNLPDDAEFIAWSDRDIYFLNPLWVENTIEKLKLYDIVQPWSEVIHLNSSYGLGMINKQQDSFSFSNKSELCVRVDYPNDKNKIATSTGQIWAINKSFYQKISKINDIEIIGGADSMIANFCILNDRHYEKVLNKKTSIKSKISWILYKQKFKDVKYSYVDGLIIHYWHGSLEDRLYTTRHDILKYSNYDPNEDIMYDENGVLQLTEKGKRLEPLIQKYFMHRKESEEICKEPDNLIFYYKYKIDTYLTPKISKTHEN
jgi:hypothetical protein